MQSAIPTEKTSTNWDDQRITRSRKELVRLTVGAARKMISFFFGPERGLAGGGAGEFWSDACGMRRVLKVCTHFGRK